MAIYKYLNNKHIHTPEGILEVGSVYCYKEDRFIGRCEFVGDRSNDKETRWVFKWVDHPFQPNSREEFEVTESKEFAHLYYSGMFGIYPDGTYIMRQ